MGSLVAAGALWVSTLVVIDRGLLGLRMVW